MTYVMSDIHGNYEKFKEMLKKINLRDDDILYILGDSVDVGDEPMELIADLSVRLNVYAIAGEHDYLAARMLHGFDKMLKSGTAPDPGYISEMTAWVQDGGQTTLDGFRALDEEQREGVLEYLADMTLFEEVEVKGKNYLLVHAGIADYDSDTELDDYQPEDFFSEALDASYELIGNTTVVVGHVPTKSGKIEYGESSIFINCGVAEGGKLACLCLETGKEYYV
ncbi:MAG: metallophosphoesterase [Clostridia bacterium]|nr:metallophosphoesterase [Clostridia bacterium]